jgi:hypothetical protein
MPAQPQEIDQQKAALLAAIAQQGSQGQVAFQAEAARRQQAQQAAVQAISNQSKMTGTAGDAPKEFTQGLQAKSNALGSVYAQDAAMSQQSFNNSIAQTSASNAAYMDQAKAAVPIVNAQTAGTVAQIRAEQEAAAAERAFQEKQRAFDAEQARIDAIEAAKDRAFAEEQRQWEREDRNGVTNDQQTADDQAGTVVRARAKDPLVGMTLDNLVKDSPDFRTAVLGIDSYASDVISNAADPEAARKMWTGDKKEALIRSLYDFYDQGDGKSAPKDTQGLGDYMRTQNLDPDNRLPGYISKREKEDIAKVKAASTLEQRALGEFRKYIAAGRKGKNRAGGKSTPRRPGNRDRNGRLPGHPAYEAGT